MMWLLGVCILFGCADVQNRSYEGLVLATETLQVIPKLDKYTPLLTLIGVRSHTCLIVTTCYISSPPHLGVRDNDSDHL